MPNLKCSRCGAWAGFFAQHSNQDTGWGVCRECVDWFLINTVDAPNEIKVLFGVAGVNYEARLVTHLGRNFKVLAEFEDSPNGTLEANAYMASNPSASVLLVCDGKVILADSSDLGQAP